MKRIEFVCYDKRLGGTPKRNLVALHKALEREGIKTLLQDWSEIYPSECNISLVAYFNSKKLRKVRELAKKHKVEVDTTENLP